MKTRRESQTKQIELVETYNLYLSLTRLNGAPYDMWRARRALYHALVMEGSLDKTKMQAIRQALELP